MEVLFFRFSKRRESTATPDSSGFLFRLQNVIINDSNSSIMSPNLRVNYQELSSSPYTPIYLCNYCYIARFERYYYIGDWSYNADGTWTASCSVDVLGSFKNDIALSSGYLSRAADDSYFNPEVMDTFYPAVNRPFTRETVISSGLTGVPSGGTYMIGVVSGLSTGESASYGAVTNYFITQQQLSQLLVDFMNTGSSDWSQVTDISADVIKSVVNPLQYVVSCKLYPFPPEQNMSYADTIRLGYWESNATGHRTTAFQQTFSINIAFTANPATGYTEVPVYPQSYTVDTGTASERTYNLPNYSPYAKYILKHPLFGTFELDPAIIASYPYVTVTTSINFLSGYATFTVKALIGYETVGQQSQARYYELIRSNFPIAIDIPLAQLTTDYMSLAKTALGGLGNIASAVAGNYVGAAVGLAGNLIDAASTAISPVVQTSNPPTGGYNVEINSFSIEEVRYATIDPYPAEFGYPVKKHVDTLPTSGFVLLDHTDFAGHCTSQEREMICEFLTGSGVFMEGFANG